MSTTERPSPRPEEANEVPSPGLDEDRAGLALVEATEADVAAKAEALLSAHRASLEQLGGEALTVLEREVAAALDQRAALQKLNEEKPASASMDDRRNAHTDGPRVWAVSTVGVALFLLWSSRSMVPLPGILLGGVDLMLILAGFFSLTAHWAVTPSPPRAPPKRPQLVLPRELRPDTSGPWRTRLENAQASQRKLSAPGGPSLVALLETFTSQRQADLDAYRGELAGWLAASGQDYLGWERRPWPQRLRSLSWVLVATTIVLSSLVALARGEATTVHFVGAFTAGSLAGFFRRAILPEVS